MSLLLYALADFITTPILRWIMLALSAIINLIKYLNEPQRYSTYKAFTGMKYKWHMFIITIML